MDIDDTIKTLDASFMEMEALFDKPLRSMETADSDGGSDDENNLQPVHDLKLFQTLGQTQSAHGIPLQDYAQYYAYCTKRLHRIRHHRDVRSQLVHSTKYKKQQQPQSEGKKGKSGGGRHAYCPRPLVPEDGIIRHEYILWNLVFQAERAWAMACSLQSSENNANRGSIGQKNIKQAKLKSRILSRLNKAVHWARMLEDAVAKEGQATLETQREVNSYLFWMLGNQQLQKKEYAAAFRFYNSSRSILLELAGNSSSKNKGNHSSAEAGTEANVLDVGQFALQDMWTSRADNLLLPLIRFCQYEAEDEDLVHSDETASVSSPKKKSGGISLEFRGHTIALDSYPTLAVLYLKLEKRLTPHSSDEKIRKKMTEPDFLQFLSDLDDALRWTAQDAQRYENLPDGPAVQAKRRELASLKAFFQYHKLSLQRQHQEERLGEMDNTFMADPAEMLHVYDSLLQNAQAMVDINHDQQYGAGDPDEDNKYNPEDDPYWLEAQAHVVRIRALRCFHLARLYESPVYLVGTSTAQVLALLQQCSHLQRRAVEEVAACDFRNESEGELYQNQLDDLKIQIQAVTARANAARFLELKEKESSTSSSSKATNRPLWLRIKNLDAGAVLADQDPAPLLIPIPCKPVFYDVAWELATDTLLSTEKLRDFVDLHEPKKKSSSGGGIFGWFSSSS